MSKFEPEYRCSICGFNFLTEDIKEHTEQEINEGIMKDLGSNKNG